MESLSAALARYVNASEGDQHLQDCADRAATMVDSAVGAVPVPADVMRLAQLEVGADLFYRRRARNGVVGLDDLDVGAAPMRIRNDPLSAARDILRPYLGPAIA